MGSKAAAAEEQCNTETEEGTIALLKKRSRRVSFAEITSVHVFDRDDEFETPPESKPSSDSDDPELGQSGVDLGFLRDSTDGDYSKDSSQNGDEDDDDELDARRSFLRPIESPSPGSTFGSATSNDEENVFGPVSTSFIRPGRLSDSGFSEEDHDMTMDSTAFSMHFQSLARSDSEGGDLKTPTGVHLSFEDKTPTNGTNYTDLGSSMDLTVAKKPISQSYMPVDKLSCGGDSNDMSLFGENPHKYDYGRLSPELDALLVGGSEDLHTVFMSDNIGVSKSPINMENKFSPLKRRISDPMGQNDGRDKEMNHIDNHGLSAEMVSVAADNKLDEANDGSKSSICQITNGMTGVSPSTYKALASVSPVHLRNVSPPLKKGMLLGKNKDSIKDIFEMRGADLDFSTIDGSSSSNQDKVFQLDVFARNEFESSLAGSVSERQIYMDVASPSNFSGIVTPSQKQTGSFVRHESRNNGESVSSIRRSISKLKMLDASPFSSSLNAKLDWADNLFKGSPFDILMERNNKDAQVKQVDATVAHFQDRLLSITKTNGEQKNTINMDGSDIATPKKVVDVSRNEEFAANVEVGRSVYHMATLSSLAEITDDSRKDHKATGTPSSFVHFPVIRLEKKSLTSPEYKGSLSRELRLRHQQNKFTKYSPGQDADSRGNVTDAEVIDKLDFSFRERAQSSSPFIELNRIKDFMKDTMDDRESELHDLQVEPETIGNLQTSLLNKDIQNFQSKIYGMNLQTGTDLARTNKDLPERGITASTASPFIHSRANEPAFHTNLAEWFAQSTSRKELHDATHNDKLHSFVLEDVPSPNSYQLKSGSENNSARKRRREVITPVERDSLDEVARIQRSLKLLKGQNSDSEFLLEHPDRSDNNMCTTGLATELKHWADVSEKFLGDTKQVLSPLSDKLNLQTICALEDFMVYLQRLKMYQMLCVDIQSQKTSDHHINLRHKRVLETRRLLHRMMHEQTKLQLLSMKREMLLKKVEQVRSGIQESQILKLNSLPRLSEFCARDTSVGCGHPQSFPFDFRGTQEVAPEKVTAMRQALEASDRKIASLTKSFHTYCKMKGEPSYTDTITLANDHLKKRTYRRFLRLELQLWDVDNLENRNGHHNIVLSYAGFITQRFTVTVGPVSSIVISTKLNDINITKNFPNMDACTAFAFVLNADTTQKYVGPISLTQETQKTSLLLGNLLDLVDEVQLAQIELGNLVQTSFHSPSVQQLDLQLCFIDFKSGRKAKLTLDISCLNRGVYPSEIIPTHMEAPHDTRAQPLLDEIRAAFQGLKVGYFRIIRLCRCVSQVVQAFGMNQMVLRAS